jgi:hypothetical protein
MVDDGIESNHPDLAPNFNPLGSWNFNQNSNNTLPVNRASTGVRTLYKFILLRLSSFTSFPFSTLFQCCYVLFEREIVCVFSVCVCV